MRILVTGGAGFIGSNFVHFALSRWPDAEVVTLDALTYAGNAESLSGLDASRHQLVVGDVRNPADVRRAMAAGVDFLVHFAAETHVDRSIIDAAEFVTTNVVGTQVVLDAVREAGSVRLVHVSTDEVYGSLEPEAPAFTEQHPLHPNSPYAASKASSDLLVLAAAWTHGVDALITRCGNNYGPRQFPEKFLPLVITNALGGESIPVYGDGRQVRDWIHVEDHCRAIAMVLEHGRAGTVYNVGARGETANLAMAGRVLDLLGIPEARLVHVADRPGHDRRYAVDPSRLEAELGWRPLVPLDEGLRDTVAWYREHTGWWQRVKSGAYLEYYHQQYRGLT